MLTVHTILRFVICSLILTSAGILWANPSQKDPDAGLAVFGETFSVDLSARTQAWYEEVNTALIGFAEKANSGNVGRLDARKIGRAYLALQRFKRAGNQLRLLGEPAGADYLSREGVLRRNLRAITLACKVTPAGQKFASAVRTQLTKQTPARMKTLGKLQELASQQKWDQAEKTLYDLFDSLGPGTIFLTDKENELIYEPFSEVRGYIDRAMSRIRTEKARELVAQRRQSEMPDMAALLATMTRVADDLSAGPNASLDDKMVTGPQAVERFGQIWREVQVGILRCRALDWAMHYHTRALEMDGGYADTAHRASPLETEFRQFNTSFLQAVARTIESDATRASGQEAEQLYFQYLRVLAPLVRQSYQRGLAEQVKTPLEKLAAKSPPFPQQVAAYESATTELLRWRARVATNLAAAQSSPYAPLQKTFFEATRSEGTYRGLFPERDPDPAAPALLASAPEVMPHAIEHLMNQKVTALDVVRLANGSPAAIGRYQMRTYVNAPAPLDTVAEIDALRSDLMVTEQAPPLTLAATQSLATAERGDYVSLGGDVVGVHLESVIVRFALLPAPAIVLTPLGHLSQEAHGNDMLDQVLMRFDLQPQWVQHDHFFVALAPTASGP